MRLLIWLCALCVARCNNVSGMFFELPGNTTGGESDANDDFVGEAISGLRHYFAGNSADSSGLKPVSQAKANSSTVATSTDILDEMETSLEHATDTLDDLWQQFKKGLASLMSSSSSSSANSAAHATLPATNTDNLQQSKPKPKPISPELLTPSSTTIMRPETTTSTITTTQLEMLSTTPLP